MERLESLEAPNGLLAAIPWDLSQTSLVNGLEAPSEVPADASTLGSFPIVLTPSSFTPAPAPGQQDTPPANPDSADPSSTSSRGPATTEQPFADDPLAADFLTSLVTNGAFQDSLAPSDGPSVAPYNAGLTDGRENGSGATVGAPVASNGSGDTLPTTGIGSPEQSLDQTTLEAMAGQGTAESSSAANGSTIGDYVWSDSDGDGTQDAGESGLANVTVNLLADGAIIQSTATDPTGHYQFMVMDPAPMYQVQVLFPTGCGATLRYANETDQDSNIDAAGYTELFNVPNGGSDMTIDAGLCALGSVGDRVWLDTNTDGVQDAGEPGFADVQVNLFNADGYVVATTTTGVDGTYRFDGLTPGASYQIGVAIPFGYSATARYAGPAGADSNVNSFGFTEWFTVGSGATDLTIDAGLVFTGGSGGSGGTIGDYVWNDLDASGLQDADEPGIQGVPVRLYEGDPSIRGTLVATTVTNASGFFQFQSVPAGTYYLGFRLVDGFAFSPANEGDDDEADSDVETDPGDGFGYTAALALAAGEQKDSVDAGQAEYTITIEYLPTGQGTTGDLSQDNPDDPDGTQGRPDFKGGWRFFPDAANYASRNDSRNKVRIRATLDKPKAGVPLYFRSFDVDDPSGNNTIDTNGANGRDNRGTVTGTAFDKPGELAEAGNGYRGRLRPVSGAFAADGEVVAVNTTINAQNKAIAEVELATSFNPGDNFRVVTSLNKPKLQALNDTTSVPTKGAITGFTGAVTDQLSVWRHFHIEQDRMKAIPWGSKLTGNITTTTEPDATTKESVVTINQAIPAADVEKYIGATLYDRRGVPNVIMKVEPGENARLTVYVHQFRPENGAFTIYKGDAVEGKITSVENLGNGLFAVVVEPGVQALEGQFFGGLLRVADRNYHVVYNRAGTTDVELRILATQAPGAVNDPMTLYDDDYSVTGDRLGSWVQARVTASTGPDAAGDVELTINRNNIANDRFVGGKVQHYGNGRVYDFVSVINDKLKVKATAALPINQIVAIWAPINNNAPTVLTDPTSDANLYDMLQVSTRRADNRYADAYLQPVLTSLSTYSQTEVTPANHVVHQTDRGIDAVFDKHRGPDPRPTDPPYETDVFWAVYVSTAFEAHFRNALDGVPTGEGATAGVTHRDGTLSAIFLETIRDAAVTNYASNTGPQISEAARRARTTVHEIGHQFLGDAHHDAQRNIMQTDTSIPSDAEFSFLPQHVVRMRERIRSPFN